MRVTIEIRRPGWMTPTKLRRARPLLLLVLALVFVGPVLATDRFEDVEDGNPHHNDISLIAAAGITQGCNPPVNDMYCPGQVVTRQQMGSFLARAAGLGTNPPVTNADKLDGLDSTALQRRVTGTCAAGSMVSAVNADGTVTCAADDVDGGDANTLQGVGPMGFYAAGSKVDDSDLLDGLDSTAFDEVELVTLAGGPVDTTAPNAEVPILLNGEPTFSFTQRAGDAIQMIAEISPAETAGVGECELDVIVYDTTNEAWGVRMWSFRERGEFGEGGTDVDGVPAPASDRTVTLRAFAREGAGCDDISLCETEGDCEADTWTVSLRVTIVKLRN